MKENDNDNNDIQIESTTNNNNNVDNTFPIMASTLNPFTYKNNTYIYNNTNNIIDEDFPQFIKNTCCPSFTFLSTTVILSLIQIVIYIITICFGLQLNATELFAPRVKTLDNFGILIPFKCRKGEIWRWLTAVFLHSNLIHLVFNLLTQIIIGSYIEAMIGQVKTVLLLLYTCITSSVFSSCISNETGTTSTEVTFALVGVYFAYTVINYWELDIQMGQTNKICNLLFVMFMITINIINAYKNALIMSYGNVSALLFAFFFGMVIVTPFRKGDGFLLRNGIWFWIGVVICGVGLPLMVVLFFTVVKFETFK
jgi:rhomboid protease GluP